MYISREGLFSDALRSIDDIMDFTKTNQLPGLMVPNVFDSTSLNFLLEPLRSPNYGHSFLKWVSVFYRVFSHDVTTAMLVSQNKEMAAMLVSQTKPLGIELYFSANTFFCCSKPIWPVVT